MRKLYARVVRVVAKMHIELFADITLLVASSYLVIKKTTDFAISDWLSMNVFHPELVTASYVWGAGSILVVAVLCKAICLIVNKFPALAFISAEPEKIADCLVLVNNEVSKHILKCDAKRPIDPQYLSDEHAFTENIAAVVKSLFEHVRTAVKPELDKRNIFISLYTLDAEESALRYELHCAYGAGKVRSKYIKLSDENYSDYECVKCVKSGSSVSYVIDKSYYLKFRSSNSTISG